MVKYEVDIKTLISLKLGFEAYFVLYCLNMNSEELMMSYISNCKKVNTEIFKELESNGYLTIKYKNEDSNIYFYNLTLTDKGKLIFKFNGGCNPISSSQEESMVRGFDEFKNNYPKSTKRNGKTKTQLHTNLKRCKQLYEGIISDGISHEDLCRCARLYIREKVDSRSEAFIQLLETWLHQRNYEAYLDESEDIDQSEHTNFDAI